MQLFSFNIISVKWLFQSDHVFWINSTKFFFKWPYNCGVFTLCSLFLKVPYATNWFHEIFLERNCNFPLLANPYFFRETKLEYTSDILQKKKKKRKKNGGRNIRKLWFHEVIFFLYCKIVQIISYGLCTVWQLRKFALTLFWQNFRESNGFTNKITK